MAQKSSTTPEILKAEFLTVIYSIPLYVFLWGILGYRFWHTWYGSGGVMPLLLYMFLTLPLSAFVHAGIFQNLLKEKGLSFNKISPFIIWFVILIWMNIASGIISIYQLGNDELIAIGGLLLSCLSAYLIPLHLLKPKVAEEKGLSFNKISPFIIWFVILIWMNIASVIIFSINQLGNNELIAIGGILLSCLSPYLILLHLLKPKVAVRN